MSENEIEQHSLRIPPHFSGEQTHLVRRITAVTVAASTVIAAAGAVAIGAYENAYGQIPYRDFAYLAGCLAANYPVKRSLENVMAEITGRPVKKFQDFLGTTFDVTLASALSGALIAYSAPDFLRVAVDSALAVVAPSFGNGYTLGEALNKHLFSHGYLHSSIMMTVLTVPIVAKYINRDLTKNGWTDPHRPPTSNDGPDDGHHLD